ncbi:hypothetical protein SDC9_130406 [bioreactor metagenome]|uniref:Uncharacterized protein n=1 Tax=bioreactor metagenome TaxID=1076179 RepID=A0A645D3Q0_9ZZZZ
MLNNFLKLVNKSNFGIIDFLKINYPNLSFNDLAFCGFIITEFSAEEISVLYDYQSESGYYMKSKRICFKLNTEKNLPTFLFELKTLLIEKSKKNESL